MSKEKEIARDYFNINPHVEKLYATSDDFLFTKKQDALNHAKTLKNKEIGVISNTGSDSETEENSKVKEIPAKGKK